MLRPIALLILFAATSAAQCVSVLAEPLLLRMEGRAERIQDLRFTCTGQSANPSTTFTVNLNAPIATPLTGVALVVGEPGVSFTPTLSAGNQLTFSNVALPATSPLSIRIIGIRIDPQSFSSALAAEPPALKAFVSTSGVFVSNPEITAGYPVPSLQTQLFNSSGLAVESLLLSPSSATLTHSLAFRETQVNSFRLQASEPGSTQSTRLVAQFSNLPPGATLSVSSNSLAGPSARLTSLESGAFNPSPVTPAYVPLTIANNSATAVWEILTTDPAGLETVTFGVIASGSAVAATVTGRYGPSDTTSLPDSLPRRLLPLPATPPAFWFRRHSPTHIALAIPAHPPRHSRWRSLARQWQSPSNPSLRTGSPSQAAWRSGLQSFSLRANIPVS